MVQDLPVAVQYNLVMTKTVVSRILLVAAGTICVVLGFIGILIPVLPTTPFLLLAAFCYMRSSRRLYNWLLNHRLFGPTVTNYLKYRAVSKGTKRGAMIILWASLLISIIVVDKLQIRLLLLLIGLAVSWHLAALRTIVAVDDDKGTELRDIDNQEE